MHSTHFPNPCLASVQMRNIVARWVTADVVIGVPQTRMGHYGDLYVLGRCVCVTSEVHCDTCECVCCQHENPHGRHVTAGDHPDAKLGVQNCEVINSGGKIFEFRCKEVISRECMIQVQVQYLQLGIVLSFQNDPALETYAQEKFYNQFWAA